MAPSPITPQIKYTAPVFVGLSLLGAYLVIYQMFKSDAPARLREVHLASKVPPHLTGGWIPFLDNFWDPAVSFYIGAFINQNAVSYNVVVDFVFSFWPLPFLIESQRMGVKGLLTLPILWGIIFQRISMAVTLPLWLLVWMHSQTRISSADISQVKAEAAYFGWWIGHNLPAIALNMAGRPELTSIPLWPAFPIWMSLMTAIYKFIRPGQSRSKDQSGYIMLQIFYATAFIVSIIAHFHLCIIPGLAQASSISPTPFMLINKFLGLFPWFYRFIIPSTGFRTPTPAETTYDNGAGHFVQMDILVCVAAAWTAGLWDLALRRPKQYGTVIFIVLTTTALCFGSLFFGAGACTALFWSFREAIVKQDREQSERSKDAQSITEESPLLQSAGY